VLSICSTLIISIIFSFLAPNGSMGRFYKIIITVFIFASFIIPVVDFDFAELKTDFDFEVEYNQTLESAASNEIKVLINDVLKKQGVNDAEIEVFVSEDMDEIYIQNITISIIDCENTEEIKQMLLDDLGLVCEVVSSE
jgi:hypothetical protein